MKCQVQWIDKHGNFTPDHNDAVVIGHCHELKVDPHQTSSNIRFIYTDKIKHSFGICAEHMNQVEYHWHYNAGGAWTFEPIIDLSEPL